MRISWLECSTQPPPGMFSHMKPLQTTHHMCEPHHCDDSERHLKQGWPNDGSLLVIDLTRVWWQKYFSAVLSTMLIFKTPWNYYFIGWILAGKNFCQKYQFSKSHTGQATWHNSVSWPGLWSLSILFEYNIRVHLLIAYSAVSLEHLVINNWILLVFCLHQRLTMYRHNKWYLQSLSTRGWCRPAWGENMHCVDRNVIWYVSDVDK